MPSKNTSILSARLKDETILTFTQVADNENMTVPRLLNAIADGLKSGAIEIEDGAAKGVTPDEIDISELKEVAKRFKKSPQEVLDAMLERSVGW